jgi:hypothetical protein
MDTWIGDIFYAIQNGKTDDVILDVFGEEGGIVKCDKS